MPEFGRVLYSCELSWYLHFKMLRPPLHPKHNVHFISDVSYDHCEVLIASESASIGAWHLLGATYSPFINCLSFDEPWGFNSALYLIWKTVALLVDNFLIMSRILASTSFSFLLRVWSPWIVDQSDWEICKADTTTPRPALESIR